MSIRRKKLRTSKDAKNNSESFTLSQSECDGETVLPQHLELNFHLPSGVAWEVEIRGLLSKHY